MNTTLITEGRQAATRVRALFARRHLVWTASLLLAAAAMSAWAQTYADELMPVERSTGVVIDSSTRSLAKLRLASGNVVDFIDLLDGHVGIGEKAGRGQRLDAIYLVAAAGATPLEVFLALAPAGSAVPPQLQADHQAVTSHSGGSPIPRNLASHLAQAGNGNGPAGLVCSGQDTFYFAWLAAFAGITKYAFAGVGHFLSGQWTFYPGKHVYEGTGTNSRTYLGACTDHSFNPEVMTMEVHRRIKTVNSGVTSYSWVKIAETGLNINEMYVFSSAIPASYRGRVKSPDDAAIDHYTVAVAYDRAPGLGIAF